MSFLVALLGSLEGVLKAFGTAVASWMGLAVDFKEAVEKMAARDVAGVKTSVEDWATGRGVASDFFSGGEGSELVDSVSAVEGSKDFRLRRPLVAIVFSANFKAGEPSLELACGDSGSAGRLEGLETSGVAGCWVGDQMQAFLLSHESDLSLALLAGVLANSSLVKVGSG